MKIERLRRLRGLLSIRFIELVWVWEVFSVMWDGDMDWVMVFMFIERVLIND